jgi:hypothetical protein
MDRDDVGIAVIYCNYKEEQLTNNLFGSILQQLVQRRGHLSDSIRSVYNNHINRQTRPSTSEYSRLLETEVESFSKVFVVLDALDECAEGNERRHTLLSELRKAQPHVRLLITSRPHVTDVPCYFEDYATLEVHAHDEDIETYVDRRIMGHDRLRGFVQKEPLLREQIIQTIRDNVKGM